MERAELYLCVQRQLFVMCRSSLQRCSKIQQNSFPKLIKYGLTVLQEPTPKVLNIFVPSSVWQVSRLTLILFLVFYSKVPSVANQVARAIAMASLASVCGLMEQEGGGMQSETISALKSLNEYFCSPVASLTHQAPLGNLNKRLIKPKTDCPRLV